MFINYPGVVRPWPYLMIGLLLWLSFLQSGVHPTVAGVLLAMVVPSTTGPGLEHRLHPWISFGIMPLFAFANAGVSLSGGVLLHPVSLGTILGLVLGKQIGITLFAWLAVRLGLAALPDGVRWIQIYAMGWLGGIGFTMSLFIAALAFGVSPINDVAKIGVLFASALSGLCGVLILLGSLDPKRPFTLK